MTTQHNMPAALVALLGQALVSRSESVTKGPVASNKALEDRSSYNSYSSSLAGNLLPHQRTQPVQYRSMLDVEPVPSIRPLSVIFEESIILQCESAIDGLVQKLKRSSATSDCADKYFFTATNGIAVAAPIRASPSPAPNGKAVSSSQEIPQTVSSTDPKLAAQQASDMRNIVRRKLTGYVGFANLPNQWHRKSVRKGFNFNVMVVGTLYLCGSSVQHNSHL